MRFKSLRTAARRTECFYSLYIVSEFGPHRQPTSVNAHVLEEATIDRRMIRAVPFSVVLLSGCAMENLNAVTDFGASNAATPHNAYDELRLPAAYQNIGRIDKTEPLDRLVTIDGQPATPPDTTAALSKGHTVSKIACQIFELGLEPPTVKPCPPRPVAVEIGLLQ
jgi:hypothetical protein